MNTIAAAGVAAMLALVSLTGCGGTDTRQPLILATTTSVEGSGLIDVLVPAFEAAHPQYALKVIAVGTGEAMKIGERGDADVLLTHDSAAEDRFVAAGHATSRRAVMHNDFVLVGPGSDPAGIRGLHPAAALARIEAQGATFVSRGDDSGTHRHELRLRDRAGLPRPTTGRWYVETGQGMLETLLVADERAAYTMTDRSTYLAHGRDLRLQVLVENAEALRNPYGVLTVAGARNEDGGSKFAEWLTSAEGQRIIGTFGRERFEQPLFIPAAGP